MLVPVPEYPIVSKKADEHEAVQLDTSLYKEDGSLEVSSVDGDYSFILLPTWRCTPANHDLHLVIKAEQLLLDCFHYHPYCAD